MADDATTSAFPDPPPFWEHFTAENLAKLKSADVDVSALPPNDPLRYLQPPPLPPNNTYWSFGSFWQHPESHPTLESAGIPRLYTTPDHDLSNPSRIIELRRLTKSLLLSFIELVGLVAIAPEEFEEKTNHIQNMLFNIHHLINQYRPHQARETLCATMEERLERVRRETAENKSAARAVEEALREVERVGRQVEEEEGAEGREGEGEGRGRRERERWGRLVRAVEEGA